MVDILMNDCYDRILSGNPLNNNYKPYTKKFLLKVKDYFEGREEYEKCKTLTDFINKRFDHEYGYTI